MINRPKLSIARAVSIYEEMVECRRLMYDDQEFFKTSDVLETLCDGEFSDGEDQFRIKTFQTDTTEDFRLKVGVVAFENSVILSMDERLLDNARKGSALCNFILAHEIGHLALEHHDTNAKILNFQLSRGPKGNSNLPPNAEELEANYAGVFFQCGVALTDDVWTANQLAKRAYSDRNYVEKAQKIVRLPEFQRILNRPKPQYQRVVL